MKKNLEINENRNIAYQNLSDAAKVVLGGKFIAIQAYLKKQEKSQRILSVFITSPLRVIRKIKDICYNINVKIIKVPRNYPVGKIMICFCHSKSTLNYILISQ